MNCADPLSLRKGMNSGFLCPECHQDLGSVKALTDHFQRVHQAREKSTASNWLDGVLGTKKDIPSQKGENFFQTNIMVLS